MTAYIENERGQNAVNSDKMKKEKKKEMFQFIEESNDIILDPEIYLHIGAPVMIVKNECVIKGLYNGAMATVLDFNAHVMKIKLWRSGNIEFIGRRTDNFLY